MKKLLITGGNGSLAAQIAQCFKKDYEIYCLAKNDLDITNLASVQKKIRDIQPDILINCAAFLNADLCEEHPLQSYNINFQGPLNLLKALEMEHIENNKNIFFVHFSTDFIFDGQKGNYTEEDIPIPLSIYGIHKWAADECILQANLKNFYVFRIASVLAPESHRTDFTKAIISRYQKNGEIHVIQDLSISLSSSLFIAEMLYKAFEKNIPSGLYHCVATGKTSWFEVASALIKNLGLGDKVSPCVHTAFPSRAKRPINSTLDNKKLSLALNEPIISWQNLLSDVTDYYLAHSEIISRIGKT